MSRLIQLAMVYVHTAYQSLNLTNRIPRFTTFEETLRTLPRNKDLKNVAMLKQVPQKVAEAKPEIKAAVKAWEHSPHQRLNAFS